MVLQQLRALGLEHRLDRLSEEAEHAGQLDMDPHLAVLDGDSGIDRLAERRDPRSSRSPTQLVVTAAPPGIWLWSLPILAPMRRLASSRPSL